MRKMKNSGIEWIGEIPADWDIVRTKNCYMHKKQIAGDEADNYERLALTLNGVTKRPKDDSTGLQPEAFNGYQVLRKNELVFKLIDLANISTSRVGYSPYDGIVSPAYIILHPRENDESKFGEYFFLSMWQREIFNHMGDDGVRSSLNSGDLLNIPYLLIPRIEKNKIVHFLDKKCAEIDVVIAKTKETIEEYKKLKHSLIMEATALGIIGERDLKPSGLEWITKIPEEWRVTKVKHILEKLERPMLPTDDVVICSNSGKAFYRGNKITGLVSLTDNGYQGVEPGDLMIHGMDTWHGAIAISTIRGKCTSVVHVCDSKESKQYIAYYLQSLAFRNVYKAITNGVRQNTSDYRSWDKAGSIQIVLPPYNEQCEIADYLNKKCDEIDTLIEKKTALLEEMESYKKSLIYEYVTGKKEVPNG